jgi:protein-L-isoaspartate(D-aspartate) O-methyltransferase
VVAGDLDARYRGARRSLVETLQDKGIRDLAVLKAVDEVPRHEFVPESQRHRAYEDAPLPIGQGQTISQPWVHARACELLGLTGEEKVLEIGTGSGYQTALLAQLAARVFSVERYPALLDAARGVLSRIGVRNVSFLLGDGSLGWRDYAPYDAIVVGAGAPEVPPALGEQLADGGRLLLPLGGRDEQMLTLVTREGESLVRRDIAPVRFVPLIGAGGWPAT